MNSRNPDPLMELFAILGIDPGLGDQTVEGIAYSIEEERDPKAYASLVNKFPANGPIVAQFGSWRVQQCAGCRKHLGLFKVNEGILGSWALVAAMKLPREAMDLPETYVMSLMEPFVFDPEAFTAMSFRSTATLLERTAKILRELSNHPLGRETSERSTAVFHNINSIAMRVSAVINRNATMFHTLNAVDSGKLSPREIKDFANKLSEE